MVTARRSHVLDTIWPALDKGQWVICDRFADSTMAYQGYGRGIERGKLKALHGIAIGDFAPDLTLILDLPPQAGLGRAKGRGGGEDRFERMDLAFHERLRSGFLEIAAAEPNRCAVIDATADADTVHQAILEVVGDWFDL